MHIHEVFTYLRVRGAAEAIAFYANAFGAVEQYRLTEPGGRIGHAELDLGGATVILSDDRVIASTLPSDSLMALKPDVVRAMANQEVVTLRGSEYAVRRLLHQGGAQVYVLDSIDATARPAIAAAESMRHLA